MTNPHIPFIKEIRFTKMTGNGTVLINYSNADAEDAADWVEMPEAKRDKLLREIKKMDLTFSLTPGMTRVRLKSLSFYPRHRLIAITSMDCLPPVTRYAVGRPGNILFLDWTKDSIYEANETLDFTLDEETVTDYLKFSLEFMRSSQGRFIVIEDPADLPWQGGESGADMAKVAAALRPVTIKSAEDGGFMLSCTILFDSSIIALDAEIDAEGHIVLVNEDVVATGAPDFMDPLMMRYR